MAKSTRNRWGLLIRLGDNVAMHHARGGHNVGNVTRIFTENGILRVELDGGITGTRDDVFANNTTQVDNSAQQPQKNPARSRTIPRSGVPQKVYLYRASQITRGKPTKRLLKRRTKNLRAPRGVFPNPSGGERISGYLGDGGNLTDFHGATIGKYRILSTWRTPRSFVSSTMSSVEATLPDGSVYTGRSAGKGMLFNGKLSRSRSRFAPTLPEEYETKSWGLFYVEKKHDGRWLKRAAFRDFKSAKEYADALGRVRPDWTVRVFRP